METLNKNKVVKLPAGFSCMPMPKTVCSCIGRIRHVPEPAMCEHMCENCESFCRDGEFG